MCKQHLSQLCGKNIWLNVKKKMRQNITDGKDRKKNSSKETYDVKKATIFDETYDMKEATSSEETYGVKKTTSFDETYEVKKGKKK